MSVQSKGGSEKIQVCPYCSARTTKSDPDFWRHIGGDCPPDQTDHHLHAVNSVSNEGMRAALRWIRQERPRLKETQLSMDFLTYVFAYEELTKDGEKA